MVDVRLNPENLISELEDWLYGSGVDNVPVPILLLTTAAHKI